MLTPVYTASLPACHPPCLQSQRKLQLSLEAHGRYITSLIEQEGLKNKLPTMAPLQSSGAMQQQPLGEALRLHVSSTACLMACWHFSWEMDWCLGQGHSDMALRPAPCIW